MISSQLVASLQNPKCYAHPVSQVTLVETHISWVFLTGRYVYKIKKPVLFSFVDFSTLEKRKWFCEEEVRLNGRLAPHLYLGVVSITGSPSDPRMDGDGCPFEWAVKMKQFPPNQEFHNLLERGSLDESVVGQLARDIGIFHSRLDPAEDLMPYGEPDMVWQPITECFEDIPHTALPARIQSCLQDIQEWINQEWRRLRSIIKQRKASGQIRECHGDLHLGNIALLEDRICVFDALEFEPRLRWIDVISEVAFLVMDLESRDRVDLAYWFLNCYLEVTGDYAGMSVFRLYEVYRALVRAKVAGLRLAQVEPGNAVREDILQEISRYVEFAHRLMMPSPPMLMLMHGVSGTGKTTVSTEVVKALGAMRVRSDVERKRIHAEQPKIVVGQETSKSLYSPDMTRATYDRLWDLANTMLQAGYSVVVDATFIESAQRQSFIRLAHERLVSVVILDVWAPDEVLAERIASRAKQRTDASDATIGVMEQQKAKGEPLTKLEQDTSIRLDSTDLQTVRSTLESLIEQRRNRAN
ncbi:AAA family ATPase [uncultured Nitrospira sp.]|uniref:bifunctional aminoglycoside phosphotransferase/ATP-binding protein n=1 Tax=uncultured Nitrospira sp. TaxID=157176 RepID=UPI0031403EBA